MTASGQSRHACSHDDTRVTIVWFRPRSRVIEHSVWYTTPLDAQAESSPHFLAYHLAANCYVILGRV